MIKKGLFIKGGLLRSGFLFLVLSLLVIAAGPVLADDGDSVYREDFTYSTVTELDLDGKFCELRLSTHEEDLVIVSAEIKETGINFGEEYSVEHAKDGQLLKIWVEGGNGIYLGSLQGKITITAPVGTRVDIRNVSGDIYIENIISDSLQARNVSGSIELNNIRAEMKLESTSGDIAITESDGDKDLKSVSGKIRVANSDGNINMRTTSGDQQLTAVNGLVTSSSISGKINLRDFNGILDLGTTSGDITGSGVFVEGDSFFKTISGDIAVEFNGQFEGLSFDLSSVSGRIRAGNIRTEKSLRVGNNGFLIKGKSTSGDQSYY